MDENERDKFINWLFDYEFNLYKIPKPDCVVFLDVPIEFSKRLMENRKNKFTGDDKKDIHEGDIEYLTRSYNNALYIADKYDWKKINCIENENLRSIDSIHEEIYKIVKETIDSMEK